MVYASCTNLFLCVVTGHCRSYCYIKKISKQTFRNTWAFELLWKTDLSFVNHVEKTFSKVPGFINWVLTVCSSLSLWKCFMPLIVRIIFYNFYLCVTAKVVWVCLFAGFFFKHAAIVYAGLLAKGSTQILITFYLCFCLLGHTISMKIQCCSKQVLVLIHIAAALELNPANPSLFVQYSPPSFWLQFLYLLMLLEKEIQLHCRLPSVSFSEKESVCSCCFV